MYIIKHIIYRFALIYKHMFSVIEWCREFNTYNLNQWATPSFHIKYNSKMSTIEAIITWPIDERLPLSETSDMEENIS